MYQSRKSKARVSKPTRQVALLRHLAGAYADAAAVSGVIASLPEMRALSEAVHHAIGQVSAEDLDLQTMGDVIVTDRSDLISRLPATARQVPLQSYHWRRLVKISTGARIRKLLEDGLVTPKGLLPHILSAHCAGKRDLEQLVPLATSLTNLPDFAVLDPRYRGLMAQKNCHAMAAEHLRDQVRKFKDHYVEMGKNCLAKNQLYRTLLLTLAGLPITKLDAAIDTGRVPARTFFKNLTSSGHARIALIDIAPDLEKAIQNHKKVEEFLHRKFSLSSTIE